jgi:hypothetical protein
MSKALKALKKSKKAALAVKGGKIDGANNKVLHKTLQVTGHATLALSSKHVEAIPYLRCKPDTLAAIVGAAGFVLLKKKKKRFAEDLLMAGVHALITRYTYSDKLEVFVSGDNVEVKTREEKEKENPPVKVRAKVQEEDGRPTINVEAEVEDAA